MALTDGQTDGSRCCLMPASLVVVGA